MKSEIYMNKMGEIRMTISEKLTALRRLMGRECIDAYLIVTDDFHSSEYVGEYFKAREYMSGFTGSAGSLVVTRDKAALWTDGRYFLQAEDQLNGTEIELMRSGNEGVPKISEYLRDNVPENGVIGFDGRTINISVADGITEKTADRSITLRSDVDLVNEIWADRPALSAETVWELGTEYVGTSREEKLTALREKLTEKNCSAMVITALDEIAWLLNLRGNDIANTPVFLGFMMIFQDSASLFANRIIFPESVVRKLDQFGITICDYDGIYNEIGHLPCGTRLLIDGSTANIRLRDSIPDGVETVMDESPVVLMKAVKNDTEMNNFRRAHLLDAVAMIRFIKWMKENTPNGTVTELSAAEKLEEFRSMSKSYIMPSFDPIIAYGPHGAIVHYEATEETNVTLEQSGLCLCDTGGHYREGTTDITRTIALGELTDEEKQMFTIVLKGNLALGAAKFVHGLCGQNLDILARAPLWENGIDFNHGTGHGVGYILSVHEGPQRFHWRIKENTKPVILEEGMVISNEPGVYLAGKFGIRHENLVLVKNDKLSEYGQMMNLETLTLVPFDRSAILPELLTDRELALLNDYHRRVYEEVSPLLNDEEREWLRAETAEITK